MEQLYTAAGCRELDRLAIAGGQPGIELMRRAGRAVFDQLVHGWPGLRLVSICCGSGNNAGDGYVIAALAREAGIDVQLIQIGDPAALKGDAGTARDDALAAGVAISRSEDGLIELRGEVIVDALLGTGLRGAARGPYATLIEAMNGSGRPILAVDLPSGVQADSGAVSGPAVAAALTVTFIGRKIGLHTGTGATLAGRVVFAELGVGEEVRRGVAGLDWLTFEALCRSPGLPTRSSGAYKQALGHIVVVGGDTSMGGAPLMAAEAALRSGAGMVTVVTRGTHRNAILSRRPELMVVDADDAVLRDEVLDKASVLVVGPGLGRTGWGEGLLHAALIRGELPGRGMVIDADGLFLLAKGAVRPPAGTVITPHTGEAAILLDRTTGEVQADRIGSACALAERVTGLAVLKGQGSVIATADGCDARCLGLCAHGNPGMATAGMGDVLAGIIGGLLAQGSNPEAATLLGTCVHSLAADRAAGRLGEASLLATDIFPELAELLRGAARATDSGAS